MKKIFVMFAAASLFVIGCGTIKETKKSPMVQGTKEVPAVYSYFLTMPIIRDLGDVKMLHDLNKGALTLFRGKAETDLADSMKRWLDEYVNKGEAADKTPIVLVGGTNILPFITLTTPEYASLGEEDKKLFDELVGYRRYTISQIVFTYLEDLNALEQKLYGISVTKSTPARQPTDDAKKSQNIDRLNKNRRKN